MRVVGPPPSLKLNVSPTLRGLILPTRYHFPRVPSTRRGKTLGSAMIISRVVARVRAHAHTGYRAEYQLITSEQVLAHPHGREGAHLATARTMHEEGEFTLRAGILPSPVVVYVSFARIFACTYVCM